MIPIFTASEIAKALDKTRRRILQALARVRPAGVKIVRGQNADAWNLEQLPTTFRDELISIVSTQGYRDVYHLLNAPAKRWEPSIPVGEIARHHIDKAARLRDALRSGLVLRDDANPQMRKKAFDDFCAEFGGVSERHWRRLLNRTVDRDAGAGKFDDIAIYLDDNISRNPVANVSGACVARNGSERILLDQLARVKNPGNPSACEIELVWTVACEQLHSRKQNGENEKTARKEIVQLLSQSGVTLSKNASSLKKLLKLKYVRWIDGGRTLAALKDNRPKNSGHYRAPQISDEMRHQIIGHARINCGGRISQAWREMSERGEIDDVLKTHHVANPSNKSYVPNRIRDLVTPDVKRLGAIHHGPREHKLQGAYHTRDWSGVPAGEWYQSDDLTAPVYFWTETSRGIEIMRGQFLPMIDERTTFILGFVLICERNYNSLAIRSLITRVCAEHGLPRSGFSFEHGIWESSKILTGGKNAVPWEIADNGLRSLGLQFRHAKLPRGKVIENSLGLLQNAMERLPGYCGRDERNDKYERFQKLKLDVEAGRIPADEAFLSESEICEQYFRICEEFNDAPQQGRKLDGLSPREGWLTLQSSPLARFDERCLHLLAHDRRKVKIGRNGITITIGKQRFNFKDEETGRRQGEEILAWFNPDMPDILACTDLLQREVFAVQRSYPLPAVGASAEQFADEERKIAAHNGYAKTLYRVVKNALPQSSFRRTFVDRKTERVGRSIATQRNEINERNNAEATNTRQIANKAAQLGIPAAILNRKSDSTGRGLDMMLAAMRRRKLDVSAQPSQQTPHDQP